MIMKNIEQLYMIEVYVEKVSIFLNDSDDTIADQKVGVKINFGPGTQFQFSANSDIENVTISPNKNGRMQRTTVIKSGKSFLFPSFPDTLVKIFRTFPLEIAVWTDEAKENSVYCGKMDWHTDFVDMVKDTENLCKKHLPLTLKQKTNLYTEYCCGLAGEMSIIIRISTLGNSLSTEFQQVIQDPDHFLFRANKENNQFNCTRVEGDNLNFCMAGSLYEPTTIEDPEENAVNSCRTDICEKTQNCNTTKFCEAMHCTPAHPPRTSRIKKYPISKIRMGDIKGPCGNKTCRIAHKIKNYIRHTDDYKAKFNSLNKTESDTFQKKSACVCAKEKKMYKGCGPQRSGKNTICSGCGGVTNFGNTCEDKSNNLNGTKNVKTSKSEKLPVFNVFNVNEPNAPTPEAICCGSPISLEEEKDVVCPVARRRKLTGGVEIVERRVLVLYTGGTIGMVKTEEGLSPGENKFKPMIRKYPQLHDDEYYKQVIQSCSDSTLHSFNVLPESGDLKWRIIYNMEEYNPLLDSSDMTDKDWIKIARDVKKNYEKYDGFVVLHGTDTMCYTASALSFMFENLGKSVVITGAQIPIFEARSDGVNNFVSSIIIAGGFNIPEVTIFFDDRLMRGNRTRKVSVSKMLGFDSPNAEPIIKVGLEMVLNEAAIFKPMLMKKFHIHTNICRNIGLLRIFPSISIDAVKASCQKPIEGLVIETYGAGNLPTTRTDILRELSEAVGRGVVIINITQCNHGAVEALYKTGQVAVEAGVTPGYDMTPEAAVTKLSYVLSKKGLSYQQKVDMMCQNIRGELTNLSSMVLHEETLKDALQAYLNIQCPAKLKDVSKNVFLTLLRFGIKYNDKCLIQKMLEMGADANAEDTEGNTPLHEAIRRGNTEIVQILLTNGASVHFKNRNGESPLITAIIHDNTDIINVLLNCGAHLSDGDVRCVTNVIINAIKNGSITQLEALKLAGSKFEITDELNQTPLHKAVLYNRPEIITYLLKQDDIEINARDILGYTAYNYALKLNRSNEFSMLKPVESGSLLSIFNKDSVNILEDRDEPLKRSKDKMLKESTTNLPITYGKYDFF